MTITEKVTGIVASGVTRSIGHRTRIALPTPTPPSGQVLLVDDLGNYIIDDEGNYLTGAE